MGGRAPPYCGAGGNPRPMGGPVSGALVTAPYGLPLGRMAGAGAGALGFSLLMAKPSKETKPSNPDTAKPDAGAGAGVSKTDEFGTAGADTGALVNSPKGSSPPTLLVGAAGADEKRSSMGAGAGAGAGTGGFVTPMLNKSSAGGAGLGAVEKSAQSSSAAAGALAGSDLGLKSPQPSSL